MPGSGKSTIGPKLADRLQVPFMDLDAFIEEQEESPVPELFRRHGESWFRQKEAEMLRKLPVAKAGGVIATGGGTPCFLDNMRFMNETGCTVFLEVPVKELAKRLASQGLNSRPLLAGKTKTDLELYLADTLNKRQAFYRQATLIIKSEKAVDDKIENLINALRSCP